jgi:hypothetical protein
MNQRGVHSQGTTGGEDRVFNTKVSDRPTVARNRTRTQWRPRRPNGKGFVNIGPKFPFTVGEEGVVRRYLPGTMGPILVGKKGSKGQTRPPRRPWPAVMRSASRRGGRSRPPPLHSECSARPPTVPPGPLRPTHDPEAPAGSPGAESGRAEGSLGPKSTRAGGRAQKLNRKARIRDVAIVRNLGCYLSRETKKRAFARSPELF